MNSATFEIRSSRFDETLFQEFGHVHAAKEQWPVVYLLSTEETREAYVGETTDTYSRMRAHLRSDKKVRLTTVHLITSTKFNKSATLDLESNLIKYLAGDGYYSLQNGNLGLANHNYFQKKELYWGMFRDIWNKLREEGISRHSIEYIENSDLFKYSPYKSLSKDQKDGLKVMIKNLLNGVQHRFVIEGGAGTGKTVLAVFLFKLLRTSEAEFNFKEFGEDEAEFIELVARLREIYPDPKMALVVPMASFRKTLRKVFRHVKGLSANMVKGPSEIVDEQYDIIVVDEAHRLRRRVNLGTYFGVFDKVCAALGLDKHSCSELDWILKQSQSTLLFYDEKQSIKPSDAGKEVFEQLKISPGTRVQRLVSQFRVRGGNDYIRFIHKLLDCELKPGDRAFHSGDYELALYDSLSAMTEAIRKRNEDSGLARLVAGYSWPWVSNKNPELHDIKIEDVALKWNSVSEDWVHSPNAVNEVGCIHTTQGYDLNYAGVIFGNEIRYDRERREIIIDKDQYFDKNGKQSVSDPATLKEFIVNIYKTIMFRAIKGTYVYVCDPALREYFADWMAVNRKEKAVTFMAPEQVHPFVNALPVYDLQVAAGDFSIPQQVADVQWVAKPDRFIDGRDLFVCRISGESMNRVIPNGSLCVFRRYNGGSRNGRIVLVEHTNIQEADFGSGYTVKEYHSRKQYLDGGWSHESIVLRPLSDNPEYEDIVLEEDEAVSLRVVGLFEGVIH